MLDTAKRMGSEMEPLGTGLSMYSSYIGKPNKCHTGQQYRCTYTYKIFIFRKIRKTMLAGTSWIGISGGDGM